MLTGLFVVGFAFNSEAIADRGFGLLRARVNCKFGWGALIVARD
jgi:hypothetical protein